MMLFKQKTSMTELMAMQVRIRDMRCEKGLDNDKGGVKSSNTGAVFPSVIPQAKHPEKWVDNTIKQAEEQETMGPELPDVSPLLFIDNQRALDILALHTLYTFIKNQFGYCPL